MVSVGVSAGVNKCANDPKVFANILVPRRLLQRRTVCSRTSSRHTNHTGDYAGLYMITPVAAKHFEFICGSGL